MNPELDIRKVMGTMSPIIELIRSTQLLFGLNTNQQWTWFRKPIRTQNQRTKKDIQPIRRRDIIMSEEICTHSFSQTQSGHDWERRWLETEERWWRADRRALQVTWAAVRGTWKSSLASLEEIYRRKYLQQGDQEPWTATRPTITGHCYANCLRDKLLQHSPAWKRRRLKEWKISALFFDHGAVLKISLCTCEEPRTIFQWCFSDQTANW